MDDVDGLVVPVALADKERYVAYARQAALIFREHGATRVVECWEDDVLARQAELVSTGCAKPGRRDSGVFHGSPGPQRPSVMRACRPSCKARACPGPAGGDVLGEPMDIPAMGRCVTFVDTEGQRNSMMASLV